MPGLPRVSRAPPPADEAAARPDFFGQGGTPTRVLFQESAQAFEGAGVGVAPEVRAVCKYMNTLGLFYRAVEEVRKVVKTLEFDRCMNAARLWR